MKSVDIRLAALRRFATAITLLTVVGHAFLGFEQSIAQVFLALFVAYSAELLLEWLDAQSQGRPARFRGNFVQFVNFLLPAHITALAITMLLYPGDRLGPVVFATSVGIGSKYIFRVQRLGGAKHFLNPSNAGICITLILFPWVGIAPPYQFTENISGFYDFLLPLIFICIGTFLNFKFTKKMPLILAWLAGFAAQAIVRNLFFGTPILAGLNPMTGVAFLLFTFYMITDPGTTPFKPRAQILFGLAVASCYALLMVNHIVFGLFFALMPVCAIRGACMFYEEMRVRIGTKGHTLPSIQVTKS